MNSRGCYCQDQDPGASDDLPRPQTFCGTCQSCGARGHARHFPGAVPYTGAWCDAHYLRLRLIHPLAFPGTLIWLVGLALVLWAIVSLARFR
jgi:hypothetical protein